ncbi:MAG: hypothetical protein ACLP8S_15825 [Solirubrobacteraceae bacterium]
MSDIGKMVRPDLLVAGGGELHGPLGPLAAYLSALEARVRALEARFSANTLMTAADAAQHARVGVETILRAILSGDLPAAGYVGRSGVHGAFALAGGLGSEGEGEAAGRGVVPWLFAHGERSCDLASVLGEGSARAPGRRAAPAPGVVWSPTGPPDRGGRGSGVGCLGAPELGGSAGCEGLLAVRAVGGGEAGECLADALCGAVAVCEVV